ncbi:MAG: hypothetical protein PHG06_21405 [Parabacteroides sp.]|nr:hypothetical protein [Parabacteroides sp.]
MANMQGKKYSDYEIAQALAIYDIEGSIEGVAREVGATRNTVRKWVMNRSKYENGNSVIKAETFHDLYTRKRDSLLKANINLQNKALQQIDKRIGEANAYQAALIYGILHDKVTRAAGENPAGSTTNILISNMGQEEATELMQRVLERANNSGKKQD